MNLKRNLFQCHFVCHRLLWTDLGINLGCHSQKLVTVVAWPSLVISMCVSYFGDCMCISAA